MEKNILNNLAIIPARGGSKRLPNKNLLNLNGKPLVSHSIEAALNSKSISHVLVSSDSDKILEIANGYKNVIIHKRKEELSTDNATALQLVEDIFVNQKESFDFISLLLPTCPFRTSKHIDEGFNLIDDKDDGVISLTTFNFPIALQVTTLGEYISLKENSPLITGNTRSQNFSPNLRPNGGFYISRWDSFERNKNFWKGKVRYYIMDMMDSVDIDSQIDLDLANLIIKKNV